MKLHAVTLIIVVMTHCLIDDALFCCGDPDPESLQPAAVTYLSDVTGMDCRTFKKEIKGCVTQAYLRHRGNPGTSSYRAATGPGAAETPDPAGRAPAGRGSAMKSEAASRGEIQKMREAHRRAISRNLSVTQATTRSSPPCPPTELSEARSASTIPDPAEVAKSSLRSQETRAAATRIQCAWRGAQFRRELDELVRETESAAVLVQATWRGHKERCNIAARHNTTALQLGGQDAQPDEPKYYVKVDDVRQAPFHSSNSSVTVRQAPP